MPPLVLLYTQGALQSCGGVSPQPPPVWVYAAAIAARRDSNDVPLGRHHLVSKRLRPVRPPSFPSWDLSVVLKGLLGPHFEPLESASARILTLKVTLLLELASFKRVGYMQTLSVSESCTDFVPGLVKAFLRPRPGYVPKVHSTSFRSQVVVQQTFSPSLRVRVIISVCSALLEHSRCMWTAPVNGISPYSC